MIFAQFWQKSAISDQLVEACGDRAIIILDGRLSKRNMGIIAEAECIKRGYLAWQLHGGEAFTRSQPISQVWPVSRPDPVRNPVWLSAHN